MKGGPQKQQAVDKEVLQGPPSDKSRFRRDAGYHNATDAIPLTFCMFLSKSSAVRVSKTLYQGRLHN